MDGLIHSIIYSKNNSTKEPKGIRINKTKKIKKIYFMKGLIMTYGLNNNTGTIYRNSNSNFNRIKNKITSSSKKATEHYNNWNIASNFLNGWQNAKTGGEKIKQIVNLVLSKGASAGAKKN